MEGDGESSSNGTFLDALSTDASSFASVPACESTVSNIVVEVRLKRGVCKAEAEVHRALLHRGLLSIGKVLNWKRVKPSKQLAEFCHLSEEVVVGSKTEPDGSEVILNGGNLLETNIHFYHMKGHEPTFEQLSVDDDSLGSKMWDLPCYEFDELWENLVFDDNIKNDLLSYVHAMLRISDLKGNSSVLRINRLVLLFGPPGTGKTSLCKSLAQKLSIQLNLRYKRSVCIEINSHSLFSKWFSESGKLVLKMFDQIEELAEDSKTLVIVLIDEVESLTMTRKGSMSRNEPMDSVRVVNALLTQIDRIRQFSNVLILATSNLNEVLDEAFVDRADICRWIGRPSVSAVYHILSSCIEEMQRIGIVKPFNTADSNFVFNEELLKLSKTATGISGRALRQIPVIAYSKATKDCLSLKECIQLFSIVLCEKAQK